MGKPRCKEDRGELTGGSCESRDGGEVQFMMGRTGKSAVNLRGKDGRESLTRCIFFFFPKRTLIGEKRGNALSVGVHRSN